MWGLDLVQQTALQDGWAALQGAVLDSEVIEDGGTRIWIRCCRRCCLVPQAQATASLSMTTGQVKPLCIPVSRHSCVLVHSAITAMV